MNTVYRKLLLFLVLVSFLSACKHDPYTPTIVTQTAPPPGIVGECDPDSIYFEKDVLPLLMGSCVAGCHDEATANEGVVLSSYSRIMSTADVKAGNPNGSELYEVLISTNSEKRMPPAPASALSAENIALIKKWIEQGALNNTCNFDTITSCEPLNVSFATDVTAVFNNNGCISCHSAAPIILNTYAGAKVVADNGKLMGAINHDPAYQSMPQGSAKIDSCAIATIQIWINEGTLDN